MERINYLALGVTLFIALTCSTLVSDLIEWKVAGIYLEQEAKELERQLKADAALAEARMKREAENLSVRNAEIARQQESYQAEQKRIAQANKIRSENAAEAQKKRMQTCQFWISEFNKSRSENDKNHRDVSCRAAGIPFN